MRHCPKLQNLVRPALLSAQSVDVSRYDALESVALPTLTSLSGWLRIQADAALTQLGAPELREAPAIHLTEFAITDLSLPKLEALGDGLEEVLDEQTSFISSNPPLVLSSCLRSRA